MERSKAGFGAAVLLFAATAVAQNPWPPDHSKANIDGKQGLVVFPAVSGPAHGGPEPFAADDCVVQLAPEDALDQRFTYRCGEWFLPPGPGGYRVWLELEGRVSSFQTFLRESETTPYRGQGFVQVQEVVPSGFVSVGQIVPRGHTVRYLNLDRPGRGFSIRVPASASAKPTAMPPGRVVAGIFNDATDEAVAYSRPLLVEEGKTAVFKIDAPSKGSDLLVHLRKPSGQPKGGDTSLRIQADSGPQAPDVLHESGNWYVAVWYGVPAEKVTLSVSSSKFSMEPKKLTLRPRHVTTIQGQLATRDPERESTRK